MADTDLIERVNVIAGLLVLSPEQSEALMDAATALTEQDARIAEVKSEAIAATTRYQDAENDVHNLRSQLTASRAECEGLRAALLLTAGALQAGARTMAPEVAFTGEWAHLGRYRVSDILDKADAALSQKETGDAA